MVDERLNIVYNAKDVDLTNAEYVVFDLETTGLSTHFDKIIEFGAVLMHKGAILERKDFFINPKRKLDESITALTNIKDSDVKDARPFEECKDEILDFVRDRILVAHNASFDFGFLNEELKRIELHAHTNKSEMDGVCEAEEIVKAAFDMQGKAKSEVVNRTQFAKHALDRDSFTLKTTQVRQCGKAR